MLTQAQRQEALLREADQIQEELQDLSPGDPRRLDLARKLRDTLAAYQAVRERIVTIVSQSVIFFIPSR